MIRETLALLAAWGTLHAALLGAAVWAASEPGQAMRARPGHDRVAIVVDSSFAMKKDWARVSETLRKIETEHPGAQFTVLTRTRNTAQWSRRAQRPDVRPFAPRDIDTLIERTRDNGADRTYLVTNDTRAAEKTPEGWIAINPNENN